MTEEILKIDSSKPILKFIDPDNEILSSRSVEVSVEDIESDELQSLIDAMFRLAYGEQGDAEHRTMVGLAAPQIGVLKRVIIAGVNAVGLGEQPELRAYINPVIIRSSNTTEDGREGCYSTGRVYGIVERAEDITIEAYDRKGNKITESYEGFPARVFQHEIDHLDGVRFPDRIADDSKLHWVEIERFGEYRQKWAEWDNYCPRERWEAMKTGQKK